MMSTTGSTAVLSATTIFTLSKQQAAHSTVDICTKISSTSVGEPTSRVQKEAEEIVKEKATINQRC